MVAVATVFETFTYQVISRQINFQMTQIGSLRGFVVLVMICIS